MQLTLPKKRSLWDLAILALGLNIWLTFLLLPVTHLDRPASRTTLVLVAAAPLVLLIGAALRSPALLLAAFPLALVIPAALSPQLVGVNIYTAWTFVLVAASFLAYLLGALYVLHSLGRPQVPPEGLDLGPATYTDHWRRRLRMYRWLAGLAAVFPAVLIYTLFLHPGVRADLRAHYPARAAEASTFFGVLGLALWLVIFFAELWAPLRAHTRGDPQLRRDLERLRRAARRGRPRPSFYIYVALALGLMAAVLLSR